MTREQPLAGMRIIVTRSRTQAADFLRQIEELGGIGIPCPVIKTIYPSHQEEMDRALRNLSQYDWVIFTSVNGVHFFLQRGEELGIDVKQDLQGKVAVVGTKTAAALHRENIDVEHIPQKFTAEDLLDSLGKEMVPGQKVLLPQANIARKILSEGLRKLEVVVDDVVAYETVPDESCADEVRDLLQKGEVDFITFTSSSTIRNFLRLLEGVDWRKLLENVTIAVIGPIAAGTAKDLGLHVDLVPEEYSIHGLLNEMVNTRG